MSDLKKQMQDIDAQIAANNAAAIDADRNGKEWLNLSQHECKQALKSKRETCQNNKKQEKVRSDEYFAIATAKRKENATLEETKKSLQVLVDAEAKSQVALANQGKDTTALRIEADGMAQAAGIQARVISDAQATALITTAEADASNSKKGKNVQLIIIISVAAVAIAIGTIILIKKVKKKK